MRKSARLFCTTVGGLNRLALLIAFGCIAAAMIVTLCDIVLRTVSRITGAVTGEALTWAIPGLVDLTQLFVVAAASLAIAIAFHRGAHVVIDLIDRLLPAPVRAFNGLLATAIAVWFLSASFWYGLAEMQGQLDLNTASSTLSISYAYYWVPMLAGLALAVLSVIDTFLREVLGMTGSNSFEAEHHDV